MKIAKIISLVCILAMAAALIYGFTVGDFFKDGSVILSNPWGVVSIVDLYVGFMINVNINPLRCFINVNLFYKPRELNP